MRHLKERKAVLAIQALDKAIAVDPGYAKAYLSLGLAHAMLGRTSRAIQMFEKFLELAPGHKAAAKVRAMIHTHRASEGN